MNEELFRELMSKARNGEAAGYLDLAGRAAASGNTGEMDRSASLVHAMVWARLAAAADPSAIHLLALAEVLAAYAVDVRNRGYADHATDIGAEVIFRLERAADLGCEDAANKIGVAADVLPIEASQLAAHWQRCGHHHNLEAEDDRLRAVACGDVTAIGDLFDIAIAASMEEWMSSSDVVAMLDVIGALGKATRDDKLVARYAGVLLMRSAYARSLNGPDSDHWRAAAEAIAILGDLCARGVMGALGYLNAAVRLADRRALIAVVQDQPDILAMIDCQGGC